MTVFDYAVLLVVGISVLLSVMRGAVREVLALGGWVAAIWLASAYMLQLKPMLPASIPREELRLLASFLIIFLSTLLVMSLISITLSELVKLIGLGAIDRGLGAVFGLARGVVIMVIAVLLAGLTDLPKENFWKHAMFSPPLEEVATKIKPWLPEAVAKKIRYE